MITDHGPWRCKYQRDLEAAKARVAALEAGINALIEESTPEWHVPFKGREYRDSDIRSHACVPVDDLRALTETDPTKEG